MKFFKKPNNFKYYLILWLLSILFILLQISSYSFDSKIIAKLLSSFNSQKSFYSLITKDGVCNAKQLKLNSSCINELIKHTKYFKNSCSECLYSLDKKKKIVYYHTIWQIDSLEDDYQFRVLKLNLMSFLSTQNLCCSKFILWKLRSFPQRKEDELKKIFKLYFDKNITEIRMFNLTELCPKANSFKYNNVCKEKLETFLGATQITDLLRFFILDIFGGIYTDGDFIYLRDMKPFWNLNFAYRWSYTDNINTAIMGISDKKNYTIFLNKIISYSSSINDLINKFYPFTILSSILRNTNNKSLYDYEPFLILHSYLFDPAWLCLDGKVERYNAKSVCYFTEFSSTKFVNESDFKISEFFPGSFGYHLHNINSHNQFSQYSYFFYFEKYFKRVLNIQS